MIESSHEEGAAVALVWNRFHKIQLLFIGRALVVEHFFRIHGRPEPRFSKLLDHLSGADPTRVVSGRTDVQAAVQSVTRIEAEGVVVNDRFFGKGRAGRGLLRHQ